MLWHAGGRRAEGVEILLAVSIPCPRGEARADLPMNGSLGAPSDLVARHEAPVASPSPTLYHRGPTR
jgi:hypothetical protein